MQPSKRSDSDNLTPCWVPSKKVPESPETDDSNKPSILKALEAVLAAGRRGFLGPAARAAVETLPDLEVCDGKVGQEIPSTASLVEERRKKKGKKGKKKKGVNMECPPVVAATLPAEDIRGQQPAVRTIWICGNLVISRSSWRVRNNIIGLHLGFRSLNVRWKGIPDLLWDDVIPTLHKMYCEHKCPSIIVIHAGETDLLTGSCCSLVTRMQNDLFLLRKAFPDVVLIWSSLLPIYSRNSSENPQDNESKLNKVNCRMEEHCKETGVHYLPHPTITAKEEYLFLPDNALSIAGLDIFLTNLKNALAPFLKEIQN